MANHKKILLFEFSRSHSECLYSQILYLQRFNYDVYLWISEDSYLNLPETVRLKEVVKFSSHGFGAIRSLARLRKYLKINGIKKMIVNTAHGKFIRNLALFFLPFSVEVIGVLHYGEKIGRSFTQSLISLKIKKYFTLNDYIINNLHKSAQKLRFREFFDLYFTDKSYPKDEGPDELRVLIPGAIEFSRKDYYGLFEAMAKNKDNLGNVKFVFLGNCSTDAGRALQGRATVLGIEDRCFFFEGFVPQETYYYQVSQSDLVMPLIHPNTKEYDSFTKYSISGAYTLAFGYRIPLLMFEDRFPDYEIFKDTAFFYRMDNLGQLLIQLQNDKVLIREKARRYNEFEKLNFEYQALNYVKFVED